MDIIASLDTDCSAFAGLFQSIMIDLKNSGPMWEDFISKTSKLHLTLKTVLLAFSSFLDAFQRIADAATNARGATKDVGAALTRLSLRHRAIEAKVKTLTSSLVECLVNPLQEKMEDWKRVTYSLDKQHTKDYKRCRADVKKRTEITARLHKKAKKTGRASELSKVVDSSMNDLSSRLAALQEGEKTAVRVALTEERSRFCTFASALKPVLIEEIGLVSELGHLQEVIVQMEKHTSEPRSLPPASEQVLEDAKAGETKWTWQTPPSSPTSSLGSRKSSMCSISSTNSSSSSTHSPAHRPLSSSQGRRLVSVCSQDSGFISQDTLHPSRKPYHFLKTSGLSDNSGASEDSRHTPPSAPQTTATWPNLNDGTLHHKSVSTSGLHDLVDRPHTISTAYERGKDRLPLTVYTFQPPDAYQGQMSPQISSQPVSPVCLENDVRSATPFVGYTATITRRSSRTSLQQNVSSSSQESLGQATKPRPPIPSRCASLERPDRPLKTTKQKREAAKGKHSLHLAVTTNKGGGVDRNFSMPDFNMAAPDMILPQPLYSNMEELTASGKGNGLEGDMSSLTSSGYGSQPNMVEPGYRSDFERGCQNSMRPHSLAVLPHSVFHSQLLSQTGPNSPRCGSLRRGHKPPPPIRRTSSITSTSSLAMASSSFSGRTTPSSIAASPISLKDACFHSPQSSVVDHQQQQQPPGGWAVRTGRPVIQSGSSGSNTPTPTPLGGSIESFPPPPAYLLDGSGGNGGSNSSDGYTTESVTPECVLLPGGADEERPKFVQDECLRNRTSSVSDTIKSLQDNHHMPPSPVSLRRAQSLVGTTQSGSCGPAAAGGRCRSERRQSLENARAALITSLSARLSHSPPRMPAPPSTATQPSGVRASSSPKLSRMRLTSVQEATPTDPPPQQQQYSSHQQPLHRYGTLPSNVGGSYIHVGGASQQQRHAHLQYAVQQEPPQPLDSQRCAAKTGNRQFLHSLNMVLAQRSTTDSSHSPASSNPGSPRSKAKHRRHQQPAGSSSVLPTGGLQRSGSSASERASKVRQWIAGKTVRNPESVRESLFDQIRRGTALKRAKHVADRSAPRVA